MTHEDEYVENDGLLNGKDSPLRSSISEGYHAPLVLARKINRQIHEMLFKSDVRHQDGEAIIIATLLLRSLEHYQSSIILLENGVVSSARVVVRALMETTFRLGATVREEGFYKKFILEDLLYRKEVANKIKNNKHGFLRGSQGVITDEALERLGREIELHKPKKFRIEELSQLAGMHDWYIGVYGLLSKAVHTQIRDLEEYLTVNDNNEVKELKYAPQLQEIPLLILTSSELILYAAYFFEERFQTGAVSRLDDIKKHLAASFDKMDA